MLQASAFNTCHYPPVKVSFNWPTKPQGSPDAGQPTSMLPQQQTAQQSAEGRVQEEQRDAVRQWELTKLM